jgi:hypothetical protein
MAESTVKNSIMHITITSRCFALLSTTSFLKKRIVLFIHLGG